MLKPLVLIVCLAVASAAVADTYVCELPNKKRVYETSPCSAGKTISMVHTFTPEKTQEQRTAEALKELEAQQQRMWERTRQLAAEKQWEIDQYRRQQAAASAAEQEARLRRLELEASQRPFRLEDQPGFREERPLNCIRTGPNTMNCN